MHALGHPLVVTEAMDHYLGVDPRHIGVCPHEDVFELAEEGCELESDFGRELGAYLDYLVRLGILKHDGNEVIRCLHLPTLDIVPLVQFSDGAPFLDLAREFVSDTAGPGLRRARPRPRAPYVDGPLKIYTFYPFFLKKFIFTMIFFN